MIRSGRPSSAATARTSSLNSIRSGSTRSSPRSSGRPPTLWCDLPVSAGLDHVGVQGSLDEEAHALNLLRLLLEDADEFLADDLPLGLGIHDAGEPPQEALLGRDV